MLNVNNILRALICFRPWQPTVVYVLNFSFLFFFCGNITVGAFFRLDSSFLFQLLPGNSHLPLYFLPALLFLNLRYIHIYGIKSVGIRRRKRRKKKKRKKKRGGGEGGGGGIYLYSGFNRRQEQHYHHTKQ